MRVLVVDDDRAAVEALRALLEMDGYDVVALSSAAEARDRLRQERFDAVVTDLEMPQVHGVEIVREARAASPPAHVLVVTAYSGSPSAAKATALGASGILGKPLHYPALLEQLGPAHAG